jgi:cbb3-type cytochrome oxidase subunit 1
MQGFTNLSDEKRRRYWLALKVVPLSGLIGVLLVTLTGEPGVAFCFAAWMAIGVVAPRHPSDLIYAFFARLVGSEFRVGRTPAPRRFSSAFAAVMFALLGVLLAVDAPNFLVVALEVMLIAAPSTIVLTNWCLPAYFYGLLLRVRTAM